ncbi:1,4-dihydroxy-2-naphthoate prenyltransferase [Fervidicella metallireducens AeB]|uniref:1,4-dihydroxy-2-naphthoate prenyltransferase n=1 Tax=Fervidicella metallireducens AeB TaxID=1403537 RepID=A0A017RZJ6_9CLOT|nr:1,4-dihydroxy-2-naphthoate polyprenyltransferase [Fervidicella metallireducens]EYE89365.1 1,4-dihydroxy-2-naphthoate prenyltransferase [Fervidicella metallireducens AeB]
MRINSFFKLVEIQTKLASVIPFSLGVIYSVYRFKSFNLNNFILMFISLITFDMATTAINNYFDYKRAVKKHGYNYELHNAIVKYSLKESAVIITISLLLLCAVTFGFLLYLNTNILVLILGVISFAVGIFYTYGPLPISRMPLGEVFSGIFMGFVIVFLAVYINAGEGLMNLEYINGILTLNMNLKEIIYIFLYSVPTINCIANVMLANNICDIEDDKENKRYTLPIYVGKENALKIFKALYYLIYIDLVILILLRVVPVVSIITLLTIILVKGNIKQFFKIQTKKDTFALSVKNMIIVNVTQIIAIGSAIAFTL